ncbi:phage minor tail protein L [Escherichia coli]|uniref:phage minor tail protein L n=1 Tax=Escherichia coli TaxID=562 RepID=UPI000BDE5B51|nr:phage minor tail protein L [Escherichia coli]EFF6684320.1 phage minor tail protein L [Escherichia coli]EFI8245142.1 phage minor tail protein L [Escherichia coli]EGL9777986.1 phage minor tail protein L [Escherichia coli]EHH5206531.1 phage minor tail protein L [Escherichia coli]EHU7971099.1 phage minor tail protein L [Escherichia coli]
MRNIPREMIIDSVDAGVGAFIDLFELDLRPLGGGVIRFHCGANGYYGDVIWQGIPYNSYPIEATGFEMKNEGVYSRPQMAVANIGGMITGMNNDYNDLLGLRVTRHQVAVKYLDAINFPNGNPEADPSIEAVSIYVIEAMSEENPDQVQYELATPVDADKAVIPGRTILADVCQWQYRGDGCGYNGGAVATDKDIPTSDISQDKCSHRLTGCRMRFPRPNPLPISCFPGSSKVG